MKKFSNKISIAFHFFPPSVSALYVEGCMEEKVELMMRKENSSLLSTVDELRVSSANLWHERESANDQTFNWNLSEDERQVQLTQLPSTPNTVPLCVVFSFTSYVNFKVNTQHSPRTLFIVFCRCNEITLIVSVSPSFFISSGADYVFTIIKKDESSTQPQSAKPLKWQSVMATDNKSTTTSTSTHHHARRRLIFITFSTFIGGF